MKLAKYSKIIEKLKGFESNDALNQLQAAFPEYDSNTITSIYSQYIQRSVKRNYYKITATDEVIKHYKSYCDSVSRGAEPGIILRIAKRLRFSPAMLAKVLLEHYLIVHNDGSTKVQVNKYLRDTTLIQDKNFSFEVYLCLLHDDVYGPLSDSIKHSKGHEYEFLLKRRLTEMRVSYHDEDHLRNCGYDKTPDIKLDVPIAVDGHVINWIESKALFGDEECHKGYLKDQLWSYWNRFGPGMVIYWFGFIEELDELSEKGILIRDKLPENIVHMNPS